jgi:hypothetical protein
MSYESRSIYPTITDPFTQNILKSRKWSVDYVLSEIKLQALFFDIVSPSISHIISSNITYNAFKKEPELLAEGIVQPQIPLGVNNADEYIKWCDLEKSREDLEKVGIKLTEKSFLKLFLDANRSFQEQQLSKEEPDRTLEERIKFLDNYVSKFYQYDQPACRQIVASSIIRDLDPDNSPFSEEFRRREEVLELRALALKMLNERGVLNRSLLFAYIDLKGLQDGDLFKKIINSIYFSAGSLVMKHMLGAHQMYIPVFRRKIKSFAPFVDEERYMLFRRALYSIINYKGMDLHTIGSLNIDTLKDLRKWCRGKFAKDLWNIIDRWKEGKLNTDDVNKISKIKDNLHEFDEIIREKAKEQEKIYKKIRRWKTNLQYTSECIAIVSFLGTLLLQKDLSWISGLSTVGTFFLDPIIKYIADKKANFIVFCEKLKSSI